MSVNPDYAPANPPLMKGHPLQYHFDPFIQNAGDFPQEKQNKFSKNYKSSSQFQQRPAQEAPRQSPPRQSYIPSNHPTSQYNIEDEGSSDYVPPGSRSRKRRQRKRYPKLIEPGGGSKPKDYYPASDEMSNNFNYRDDESGRYPDAPKKLTPAELHKLHHGESREIRPKFKLFKKPPYRKKKDKEEGPMFSENAYVLMFPNMVPEGAMLPLKPYINGKHIPVLSASDPAVMEKALATAASPGYHPAKVHPREQMVWN